MTGRSGRGEVVRAARVAAAGKDVIVIGGANTAQQCVRKGLLDCIRIRLVPAPLGDGLRLFDHLDQARIDLRRVPSPMLQKS